MRDLLECAVRELLRRKGRTLGVLVGYLLAVAIVVVLVTAIVFARQAAGEILTSTGTHFIAFAPASPLACPACSIKKPAIHKKRRRTAGHGATITAMCSRPICTSSSGSPS